MPNNSVSYHDTLDVDMKFKKEYEMCIKTYIAFEKKNQQYLQVPSYSLPSFFYLVLLIFCFCYSFYKKDTNNKFCT